MKVYQAKLDTHCQEWQGWEKGTTEYAQDHGDIASLNVRHAERSVQAIDRVHIRRMSMYVSSTHWGRGPAMSRCAYALSV